MAVLAQKILQEFHQLLTDAQYKSQFDEQFLQDYNLEALYALTIEQWIAIYEQRLIQIRENEFSWIEIGQIDWIESNQHANHHWYALGIAIAQRGGKHITQVIFANVEMSEKDRESMNTAKNFSCLIFSNHFKRLNILNRFFHSSAADPYRFASYDAKTSTVPVSPFELAQIYKKLTQHNTYYKPIVVSNWTDFVNRYGRSWRVKPQGEDCKHIDALIYPLYHLVGLYFSELEEKISTGSTINGLDDLYEQHLKELSSAEVNYFYGQVIDLETGLALYDIFNLLRRHSSASVLIEMVKLSIWITQKNPAMIFDHPMVLEAYHNLEIGPYLTQRKLRDKLQILLRSFRELEENERLLIESLVLQLTNLTTPSFEDQPLVGPVKEQDLFNQLQALFKLRDEFNLTQITPKITTKKILYRPLDYFCDPTGVVNALLIDLARSLQGCGFWQRHGVEDYFQILFPGLKLGVDTLTREPLSSLPLSYYIRPDNDSTYLICLLNSEQHFHSEFKSFSNVNAERAVPLSPDEYDSISLNAPVRFQKYPRIPEYTKYILSASTLKELTLLINDSLNYEATLDDEGYKLCEGFSGAWLQVPERVVEYEIEGNSVSYQIRDSWNKQLIYTDNIVFLNASERRMFINSSDLYRLRFILNVAVNRGHARANLTISKYFTAYRAYVRFRAYVATLSSSERYNLYMTSMRYGREIRRFEEVWKDGYPDCMSAASKWFVHLVLDYLPDVRFSSTIEQNSKFNDYLLVARRDSQKLYTHFIQNDLTRSVQELTELLTRPSSQIMTLATLGARGMEWLGVNVEANLEENTARLLSITDSIISPLSRSGLHQLSLFRGNTTSYLNSNHSSTTSEAGSVDSTCCNDLDDTKKRLDTNSSVLGSGSVVTTVSSSVKSSRAVSPHTIFGLRQDQLKTDVDYVPAYLSFNPNDY